jgi:predicted acyltransferase
MNTSAAVLDGAVNVPPARSPAARIRSIDVLRGLTVLVMIFVNDLASVKGLPWWTYHMPSKQNGMTYVDVVFPAFLFLVGMAIPLAIDRRVRQGDSGLRLWSHILMRSVSLVVLGLVIANAGKADPNLTGMPGRVWGALALTGAILFWLVYPRNGGARQRVLRYGGLAILIVCLAIFRRTTSSGPQWLDFRYWEILGLIGRAYLAACILYVPLRNKVWWPASALVVLTAFNVVTRTWMPVHRHLPYALWPFDSGALPSIVMAGIVAHQIFFGARAPATFRGKALMASAYAALLFISGWALSFLGISKNGATPTWCLYSSGITLVLFLLVYWFVDVRGLERWTAFVDPAGSNTLLTYLLPFLFYYVCEPFYHAHSPNAGAAGLARSVAFTAFMLTLSWLLTRKRIRMQL